jgi:hypothetical protein
MDNIYPNNINKILIHPSNRKLIGILRHNAYKTCRTKIGSQYIHTAFNKLKRGHYYTNDINEVIAFCIWEEKNILQKDDTHIRKLHILLVCADENDYKLGRKILYDVDYYCIDNKIPIIILEAANDTLVKYYENGGFKLLDNITKEMKKDVKLITIEKEIQKQENIKEKKLILNH